MVNFAKFAKPAPPMEPAQVEASYVQAPLVASPPVGFTGSKGDKKDKKPSKVPFEVRADVRALCKVVRSAWQKKAPNGPTMQSVRNVETFLQSQEE